MLSYRHAFHAGNFADVVKHVVLVALVEALARKETPFCWVDTHAGAGGYDLGSRAALRHREHAEGIERVLAASRPPPLVRRYLDIVRAYDAAVGAAAAGEPPRGRKARARAAHLRRYPGSPRVARALLRASDRIVLCELHPADGPALKAEFRGDRQAHVHQRDGYEAFGALVPPRERRGCVLIDPSYETADEIARIAAGLATARQRWPGGVYAVWYPLLARKPVDALLRAVIEGGWRRALRAEVTVRPPDSPIGLNGAGVLLLNAPWKIDEAIQEALPWLARVLGEGAGTSRLDWLVGE